jgi:hypothetical protein
MIRKLISRKEIGGVKEKTFFQDGKHTHLAWKVVNYEITLHKENYHESEAKDYLVAHSS